MITIIVYTQQEVLDKICKHFQVKPSDFLTPSRGGERPEFIRNVYSYSLNMYAGMKEKDISDLVGRDRSTVIKNIQRMKTRATVDKDYRDRIIEIENLFEE